MSVMRRTSMMKNENSGVGNRMISVNLEVLNQGLMTAFQGVAMIFSSLGAIDAAEEIGTRKNIS